MKQSFRWGFSAFLIGAACFLNGCAKEQIAQPTPQVATGMPAVQVANERMVFADQKAFEETRSELEKMSRLKKGEQLINAWENSLRFKSLRTAAIAEGSHLEQLELAGRPATAYHLMDKFGFPTYYAALVNPSGEYQIGAKIYFSSTLVKAMPFRARL